LFRVVLLAAAALKSTAGQSRRIGDLRQSDRGCAVRAGIFWRGQTRDQPEDYARLAYLGIVQIGFAYLLFTLAMARGLRSLDAGIIGYVEPVLNPIWVFLFLGERPSGWAIIGGVIIIASVIVHMLFESKSKRTKMGLTS
jgi:drug/metabolite transporter (DMT)-like permease